VGLFKETVASGRTIMGAKTDTVSNKLSKAVAADQQTSEGREVAQGFVKSRLQGAKREDIKGLAIDVLQSVRAIVDQKAPGDAADFQLWLQEIASNVAAAAKEGGFLGIGGVAVSDAEKATLAEIQAALAART
jgi:hypothetical protein